MEIIACLRQSDFSHMFKIDLFLMFVIHQFVLNINLSLFLLYELCYKHANVAVVL